MASFGKVKDIYFIAYLDTKKVIVDDIEWGGIQEAVNLAVSRTKEARGNITIPQFYVGRRTVTIESVQETAPPPPPSHQDAPDGV